jgi:exonuclease III
MHKRTSSINAVLILALTLLTQVLTATPSWAQLQKPAPSCDTLLVLISSHSTRESLTSIKPIFQAPTVLRRIEDLTSLRLMTYNVKNLFTHVGDFERVAANKFSKKKKSKEKPVEELRGVAKAIIENQPDIIVLQEIEGFDSLEDFNDYYLKQDYQPYLIHGNDNRGIDIGFLIKGSLPLKVVEETHRDIHWNDPADHGRSVPLFSRDLPALLFFRLGDDTETATPLLVVLGNHGKSKRDRLGDPNSNLLRTAQYDEANHIIESYFQRFGNNLPLVMAGDFNTDVRTGSEVQAIRDHLKDVFDLAHFPERERITHTFHPRGEAAVQTQLDAVLLSPSLIHSVLRSEIYRYKDNDGKIKPLPKTYEEREGNPSDHYPIVVDISTETMIPEAYPAQKKAAGF